MRSSQPNHFPWPSLAAALVSLALVAGLAYADSIPPLYLPAIYLAPTFTPTATAVPNNGSPDQIQGSLSLCNPGQSVYAPGSTVCVVETLANPGPAGVGFGLVGVAVNPGGAFQTSWNASPDPAKQFWSICPGCTGPMDGGGGAWQDNVRGPNGSAFTTPGAYTLTLAVCYDTIQACASGQAPQTQWRTYNTLNITIQ